MTNNVAEFARTWVLKNVHNEPLADGTAFDAHVASLTISFLVDASRAGIALPEIEKELGNLEDWLEAKFQRVFFPEAGGIKD